MAKDTNTSTGFTVIRSGLLWLYLSTAKHHKDQLDTLRS